jgi:hypothetical protein
MKQKGVKCGGLNLDVLQTCMKPDDFRVITIAVKNVTNIFHGAFA